MVQHNPESGKIGLSPDETAMAVAGWGRLICVDPQDQRDQQQFSNMAFVYMESLQEKGYDTWHLPNPIREEIENDNRPLLWINDSYTSGVATAIATYRACVLGVKPKKAASVVPPILRLPDFGNPTENMATQIAGIGLEILDEKSQRALTDLDSIHSTTSVQKD